MSLSLVHAITSFVEADDAKAADKLCRIAKEMDKVGESGKVNVYLSCNRQRTPQGFARGMNNAFQNMSYPKQPDYLLCFNDDIEFVDDNWFCEIWKHRCDNLVTCPTTNFTKCPEQVAQEAKFEPPRRVAMVPAICWLIPCPMVLSLVGHFKKPWIFDETLGRAWGEDDLTAAIWRKKYDPLPFLIAPTSFVRHIGSQTSNLIPAIEREASVMLARDKIRELEKS